LPGDDACDLGADGDLVGLDIGVVGLDIAPAAQVEGQQQRDAEQRDQYHQDHPPSWRASCGRAA
jgi:hypothetical protein